MINSTNQSVNGRYNITWVPSGDNYIAINPASGEWLYLDPLSKQIVEETIAGAELSDILKKHPFVAREDVVYLIGELNKRDFRSEQDVITYHCRDCQNGEYPTLAVLNLTERCNLKCTYCYVGAGEGQVEFMKPETAYRIIDEYVAMNPNDKPNITLHGGEPLMDFSLVEKIINYAKPVRDKLEISIQTNATLLNEERVRFLKENDVTVGVSIDGPKEFHDQTRKMQSGKGSFDQVMRGIRLLQDNDISVGTISVLTGHDIDRADEIVDFFAENNIFSLSFLPMQKIGRGLEDEASFLTGEKMFEGFKKVIDRIVEINSKSLYPQKIYERKTANLAKNVFYRLHNFMCMRAPCGAGREQLGFGIHGDFYLCDDFINDPEFRVGSVYEGSIPEQMRNSTMLREKTKRAMSQLVRCRDCTWRALCGGICFSADHYSGAKGVEKNEMCEFFEKIIPYMIELYAKNPDLPMLLDSELGGNKKQYCIRVTDVDNGIDAECMDAILKVHSIGFLSDVYLDWRRIDSRGLLPELVAKIKDNGSRSILVIDPEAPALTDNADKLLANEGIRMFLLVPGFTGGHTVQSGLEAVGRLVQLRGTIGSKNCFRVRVPLSLLLNETALVKSLAESLDITDCIEVTGTPKPEEFNLLNACLDDFRAAGYKMQLLIRDVSLDMLTDNNLEFAEVKESKQTVYIDDENLQGRQMEDIPD
ncbi:MAG: radical SAM protein [Lachnospiraceae bacterium]|nr:radical SAM protein [Lachnospiraceae bacterium]